MKKIVTAIMLTVGIFGLAACSSDDSEVVVQTNIGDISKDEFYDELRERTGEQVLQEMITIKILEEKFSVEESEVDEQINTVKDQFGEQFDMVVQQEYGDEETFRELIRVNLLFDQAVYGEIEISDEEIEDFYSRITSEIEAEHILVEDEETANEIVEKLENGEDFAELAKEHSTDPGSAENGGALGVIQLGQMVPEFEDAVYELDVDVISDPVETTHGFHVIRVTEKRDISEEIGSLEDNKTGIINTLRQDKVDPTEAQAKITELIDEAEVDIKISEYEDLFNVEG